MRIGIFGGTFDPPHLGHLILAAEASYQLALDRLLFVLTPDPPHKKHRKVTGVEDRQAMLEAAIADNPAFELSRIEIDRPGPHYTVDTVRLLRGEYPQDELIYLMGGDSLENMPVDWYKPAEFVQACDYLGVMRRPHDEIDLDKLEALYPGIKAKVQYMDAPLLEIASREIRQRAAGERPYRYYLPASVCRVIRRRGLYRYQDTLST